MRLFSLNLLLILNLCAYSQEPYKFINYTTVNGLADNRVLSITQDSRGFMWFGTSEGLSRFDGNKFENYFADPSTSNSLPDNIIIFIDEFKPGHLLILSGARLHCLNTLTRQFYVPSFAQGKIVYSITKSGSSGYIMSCLDTGFVITRQLNIIDTLYSPFNNKGQIVAYWNIDKNHILGGRNNEYYLYDKGQKKYKILIEQKNMPPRDRILAFLYFDSTDQSLYFSNYFDGLYKYDMNGNLLTNWKLNNNTIPFGNGNISFIVPKNDSLLWMGSGEEYGLAMFNKRTKSFIHLQVDENNPSSLVGNSVLTTYTDKEGNEWFGTATGLSKINKGGLGVKKWNPGMLTAKFPFISIKKAVDGNYYVARFGYPHIWKINRDNDSIEAVSIDKMPPIWCFNSFGNRLMATGTGTSITEYDPLTKKYKETNFLKEYYPKTDIVVLAFTHSNGDEWYSGNAGGGFVRISATDKSIHHYKKDGPAGSFFISYYPYHLEDKNGDLWFGVNKSAKLLHWSLNTQRFNEIDFNTISNTQKHGFRGISDLVIDGYGKIWVGFDGSGIVRFDPEKNETVHYTIANGLTSNYISSMEFDDKGRLWIGTLKGLTCLIPSENKFINFSRKDGFVDDYFADRCILFDSTTHQLWIGAASALMRFDPDELLKSSTRKFPVYIDAIVVNNELFIDQNATNTSLTPGQNNLQFTFIGLDPEGGKSIEYSYKLIGADKDWISNNTTTASYNSLNSGDYTFVVRARFKGDTEWMTIQEPFKFTIQTPWYQTWWFRISAGIAFVALSWLLIRTYYRNKFLRQKAMMEKEIAIEQERTKMARELHDGLGSMLSGIKHSFTAMTKEFNLNDKQELLFHSNLDKLNESIKELRNISHNMASDSLLKYGLENSLRDYCNNASLNSGIPVSFTALNTKDINISEEKSVHIFRIIQELFQNIINHSQAKNVVVQISNNNKHLYITVEDDGKGFDLTETKKRDGIGLKNIESRVKLLKGDLDYKTAPGKGVSVLMSIPYN